MYTITLSVVWVTDGCTTIHTEDGDLVTCECDHLTNFASLVVCALAAVYFN